jgi:hypothetical protein
MTMTNVDLTTADSAAVTIGNPADDRAELDFWAGVLEDRQDRQMIPISRESLTRLLRIARGVKTTLENAHG